MPRAAASVATAKYGQVSVDGLIVLILSLTPQERLHLLQQPLLLLRGDDVEGKARLLGLLLSYVVLLKTLFPVRLGSHPPCQRQALGERRIEKESCVHRQHPPANAVHAAAPRRAHAAQRPGRGRPRIAQGGDPLAGGELARGRAPVRRGAAAALRRGARGAVCAQPDAGACSLALVLGDVGVRSHA